MKLFLIRHGDFDKGSTDLNKTGRNQALKVAKQIRKSNLNNRVRIYSSLGPRSIETTEIIASKLGVENRPKSVFGSNYHETTLQFSELAKRASDILRHDKRATIIVSKGEFLLELSKFYMSGPTKKQLKGSLLVIKLAKLF